MTYAKFGQEYLYDPAFLNLTRDARLFCFEATQWSAMTMTDGHVSPSTFRRFSDSPDPDSAVRELLAAGLLEVAEAGYQLTRFTDEQMSAAQEQANKDKWKKDKKRSAKHKAGDHSMCTRGRYCPAGELEPNYPGKVDSTVEAPVESEVEAPVSASSAVVAAVAVATPRERKQEAAEAPAAAVAESPGLRPAPRSAAPAEKEEERAPTRGRPGQPRPGARAARRHRPDQGHRDAAEARQRPPSLGGGVKSMTDIKVTVADPQYLPGDAEDDDHVLVDIETVLDDVAANPADYGDPSLEQQDAAALFLAGVLARLHIALEPYLRNAATIHGCATGSLLAHRRGNRHDPPARETVRATSGDGSARGGA